MKSAKEKTSMTKTDKTLMVAHLKLLRKTLRKAKDLEEVDEIMKETIEDLEEKPEPAATDPDKKKT